METKQVYRAIAAVAGELARNGIAKAQTNQEQGYQYRGIDDIYNRLGPLLAQHGLCILPRMLERERLELRSPAGDPVFSVAVRAAFDFVSAEDGSCHTIETFGEAFDPSDKATNKAMSAAYKYAALQAFCIPTGEENDADQRTLRVSSRSSSSLPPPEGWEPWVDGIGAIAQSCESEEALSRLQLTYRGELRALSSFDAKLYNSLGAVIQARRATLRIRARAADSESTQATAPDPVSRIPRPARSKTKKTSTPTAQQEPVHAAA